MARTETLAQVAIILVGVVVVFAALHIVGDVFAPIALALVTGVVLSPVSDLCDRRHLPHAVGATLTLCLTLVVLSCFALLFQPAIEQLVKEAPKVMHDVRDAVEAMRSLLQGLGEVSKDVSQAIAPAAKAAEEGGKQAADTGVKMPDLSSALMMAPTIVSGFMIFVGALFFFLLTRMEIYDWAARRLFKPEERGRAVVKMRAAERRVARYFMTISVINAGLGICTGVALQLMGLPQAMSWGLIAFVLNFIPYLGPGLTLVALIYAGVASFDGANALLPGGVYILLIVVESQFVTPTMVGKHVAVNPLLVFLALIFGFWLWGPVGGVVAIPLLLWGLVLAGALPEVEPDLAVPPNRQAAE
ncbi:AI-2E family transporter [Acidimangrovimonas sediminis]|uniref:AI-2E family transporter n=1 Tax=Acidimangrovimonas sediminis TaxID=2056283 RepID=UPI001304F67C|nr:AI-2E family transporter [Acidimangrovimonas sediminis]